MKKSIVIKTIVLAMTIACTAIFLQSAPAQAGSKVVDIEDQQFSMKYGFDKNLMRLKGKKVKVHLASGQNFYGKVKEVDNSKLLLSDITPNYEFTDVMLYLNQIVALQILARKYE